MKLLAVPITCDYKKKKAGMLERLKSVGMLHVPPMKGTDADTEQYLEKLYRFIPQLEQARETRSQSRRWRKPSNRLATRSMKYPGF